MRLVAPAAATSAANRSQPYASSSDAYVIGTSGVSPTRARTSREALEAGARPHPARERPLGGAPDHRPVGERVGEREAELDDVGAALHRGLARAPASRART